MSVAAAERTGPWAEELHALLTTLIAKRWWIVAIAVVITAAFTTVAFVSTPVYRATTVLVPANNGQGMGGGLMSSALEQFGGLASLAGVTLGTGDRELEEALGVLRSRQFNESFIERHGLRQRLFYKLWDSQARTWNVPVERQPTPAKAFKHFDKNVRTITRDRKSGLITVQIDWIDRNEAATWLNELVRELNAEMRSRAIADADAYVGYLEKEFQQTSIVASRDAIGRLIEAQIKRRMVATVSPEFAFRVVDKALPADHDDPVKPRKLLLLMAGPVVGVFVGVFFALASVAIFGLRRKARVAV